MNWLYIGIAIVVVLLLSCGLEYWCIGSLWTKEGIVPAACPQGQGLYLGRCVPCHMPGGWVIC